jgi:hypothetical protein
MIAVVADDFFRGADREREKSAAVFHGADEHADDLALEIQQRRAAFAALDGGVGADVPGGEVAVVETGVEARDHTETRRKRQLEWKADGHHGRADHERGGLARFQKRQRFTRFDLDERDAAARIGHEPAGGKFFVADGGDQLLRSVAEAVAGDQHALGVHEETGADEAALFVLRLDAADGGARLVHHAANAGGDAIGEGRRGRGRGSDGRCGDGGRRRLGFFRRPQRTPRNEQRERRGAARSESASAHSWQVGPR